MASNRVEYPTFEFDRPLALPRSGVQRYVWGDEVSGFTSDSIYVSTETVSQVVFAMGVGRGYRHSHHNKAIYPADEIWYVLTGTLVMHNPERGEVQVVNAGESVFFRGDTWHYAYNYGTEPLQILEFSAPPAVAAVRYSEGLGELEGVRGYLVGRGRGWPMNMPAIRADDTLRVLTERDYLWSVSGDPPLLAGTLASTEHLTVIELRLLPGQLSAVETHTVPETGLLLDGVAEVHVPHENGADWIALEPLDGYALPVGTPHRYLNSGNSIARILLQLVGDATESEDAP